MTTASDHQARGAGPEAVTWAAGELKKVYG